MTWATVALNIRSDEIDYYALADYDTPTPLNTFNLLKTLNCINNENSHAAVQLIKIIDKCDEASAHLERTIYVELQKDITPQALIKLNRFLFRAGFETFNDQEKPGKYFNLHPVERAVLLLNVLHVVSPFDKNMMQTLNTIYNISIVKAALLDRQSAPTLFKFDAAEVFDNALEVDMRDLNRLSPKA